jgi:hypothetical protein
MTLEARKFSIYDYIINRTAKTEKENFRHEYE